MKKLVVILSIMYCSCSSSNPAIPIISIETDMGTIEAELYPEKAPKTVAAFLSYIDSGYYNNSSFYRVVLTEGMDESMNTGLIQGGIWPSNNKGGIKHESTKLTGLSHTSGTLSLARTGIGTAGTEFFICIGDQTQFDEGGKTPEDGLGFSAFGKVTKGMSIVRAIQRQPRNGEKFEKKITIKRISRL